MLIVLTLLPSGGYTTGEAGPVKGAFRAIGEEVAPAGTV